MADMTATLRMQQQQSARMRALVFPREHGAWGILLVPLVTGACIGIPSGHGLGSLMLFLTTVMSLFLLRTPVESYFGMGTMRATTVEERRRVMQAIAAILPITLLSSVVLLWRGRNAGLLLIASITGFTFAMQAIIRQFGRKMRMPAQIIGSIGLTSTAAGAYYVVTGHLDARALAIWLASFLFAGNQIHYVQLRMRNSRVKGVANRFAIGRTFMIGQLAMLAAATAACVGGVLPALAIAAFFPIVFRGAYWLFDNEESMDVHWLGITELLQGITFGVLLTATFFVHM